jgi:hypothetical protein
MVDEALAQSEESTEPSHPDDKRDLEAANLIIKKASVALEDSEFETEGFFDKIKSVV